MKRRKTGEAHRVETASDGRSGNAAEHIVAADHVGDLVLTDQPDRRLSPARGRCARRGAIVASCLVAFVEPLSMPRRKLT